MDELITDEPLSMEELLLREAELQPERLLSTEVVRFGGSGGSRLLPMGPQSADAVDAWLTELHVDMFSRGALPADLLLTGRGAVMIVVGVIVRRIWEHTTNFTCRQEIEIKSNLTKTMGFLGKQS